MKKELERLEIPGENDARERSRAVVQAAFAEREPQPRRRSWKPAAAIAIALVALAGLLSPPGRAVLDEIREVVGVEQAQPALFSLPAPGRLLVTADSGAWVVEQDGSKRLLGTYREASWSPFGRFVVASRRNELVALTPEGEVRWSLARPEVRFPRWGGTKTDTRIAYLSGDELRIVGGDGRGDAVDIQASSLVHSPLAWRAGRGEVLAYVVDDVLRVVDIARRGEELWSVRVTPPVASLAWSDDGKRLLALSPQRLVLFAGGRIVAQSALPQGGIGVAAVFEPNGWRVATVTYLPRLDRSELRVGARLLFSGRGRMTGAAWSPNGQWVVVSWRDADQWVFVRATAGEPRIVAVSDISTQFRSASFPRVEGWCCAP